MSKLDIEALMFDVGGTVFDWQTAIRSRVTALGEERGVEVDAPQFALDWRMRFFQFLAQVRAGERPWCGADALQFDSVSDVAKHYQSLALNETDCRQLSQVWHELKCWPDFPAALERMRERYKVVVLTVMSFSIIVDSSRHSGISWDGILSGEFMKYYKPNKEAYLEGAERIGVAPGNIMMVAAHPNDLRASMVAGFHTAYVQPKLNEPGGVDGGDPNDFDIQASDFTDLADQLLTL